MRINPEDDIWRVPFLGVVLLVSLETPLRIATGSPPAPWAAIWDIIVGVIYLSEFLWHGRFHRGATALALISIPPWELLLGAWLPGCTSSGGCAWHKHPVWQEFILSFSAVATSRCFRPLQTAPF